MSGAGELALTFLAVAVAILATAWVQQWRYRRRIDRLRDALDRREVESGARQARTDFGARREA